MAPIRLDSQLGEGGAAMGEENPAGHGTGPGRLRSPFHHLGWLSSTLPFHSSLSSCCSLPFWTLSPRSESMDIGKGYEWGDGVEPGGGEASN